MFTRLYYSFGVSSSPPAHSASKALQHFPSPRSDRCERVDDLPQHVVFADGSRRLGAAGRLRIGGDDFADKLLIEGRLARVAPVHGREIAVRFHPRLLESGVVDDLRILAGCDVCIIGIVRREGEHVRHSVRAIMHHVPRPVEEHDTALAVRVEHVLVVVDEVGV